MQISFKAKFQKTYQQKYQVFLSSRKKQVQSSLIHKYAHSKKSYILRKLINVSVLYNAFSFFQIPFLIHVFLENRKL
jgi:hypothetical protein